MKRILFSTIFFLMFLLAVPADAIAQRVRISIGGPRVTKVTYRPGHLTLRTAPRVVVVRQRTVRHGYAIVYKDRPQEIYRSHHQDLLAAGFTRVSIKVKSNNKTTGIYKRGHERVRLVVKPSGRLWEAEIVAL